MASFGRGLSLSLSKPYLAACLWLVQLLLSLVVIIPVSNSLHALLDQSPAGSRMVADPDYGWWETVTRTHAQLLGNLPERRIKAESSFDANRDQVEGVSQLAPDLLPA